MLIQVSLLFSFSEYLIIKLVYQMLKIASFRVSSKWYILVVVVVKVVVLDVVKTESIHPVYRLRSV